MDTTSPRISGSPSLYDPAVALDFFQFAGKPQTIAKGTTIFSENRKSMPLLLMPNRIYLLLQGEVEVVVKGEPIATIRAGEIFGEMASMGQMPRSASAVAKRGCRVIGLDDTQFRAALGRTPGFALMLMSIMIGACATPSPASAHPLKRTPGGGKPPRSIRSCSPISRRCSDPRRASATRPEGSS